MSDERPPDFTGNLEGFLAYAESHPAPFNPDWCSRHWAPCPVEGKNGLLASILIVQVGRFRDAPADLGSSASAFNSWFENQTVPTCCRTMGDEEMAKLWALVDALHVSDRQAVIDIKTHFGLPLDGPPMVPEGE